MVNCRGRQGGRVTSEATASMLAGAVGLRRCMRIIVNGRTCFLIQQTVPPWEPPETEVVPGSSPRAGEVVFKALTPRMIPSLNQRLGLSSGTSLGCWGSKKVQRSKVHKQRQDYNRDYSRKVKLLRLTEASQDSKETND
eukprot:1151400-Pelagomonas_calceolata.AAC.2